MRSLVAVRRNPVAHAHDGARRVEATLLSPEQLDPALTREVENLQRIIAGVEFDAAGRRVAYHVYPRAADQIIATMQWAPIRLPAEDVLHIFEQKVPGQVRGPSWLAPVLTTILQIDQLQDAGLNVPSSLRCLLVS